MSANESSSEQRPAADGGGMGRRSLVLVLALAGALLVLVLVVSLAKGWWRGGGAIAPAVPAGPAVRGYFGDLAEGSKIDRWTLVRVFDVRAGAIPVVLATADGKRYQVDLMRLPRGGPPPVASTSAVALYLANGSNGDTQTPEEQGLGIKALASALATRENAGAKPPQLSTLTERLSGFPDRHFKVPLDP